jgi:hypothetical protein
LNAGELEAPTQKVQRRETRLPHVLWTLSLLGAGGFWLVVLTPEIRWGVKDSIAGYSPAGHLLQFFPGLLCIVLTFYAAAAFRRRSAYVLLSLGGFFCNWLLIFWRSALMPGPQRSLWMSLAAIPITLYLLAICVGLRRSSGNPAP